MWVSRIVPDLRKFGQFARLLQNWIFAHRVSRRRSLLLRAFEATANDLSPIRRPSPCLTATIWSAAMRQFVADSPATISFSRRIQVSQNS
jgi:hypothetical protein